MGSPARLIVNMDVPDLAAAEAFYTAAFGVSVGRRLDGGITELVGFEAPLYLIEAATRDYARHWTPIHLDIVVDDIAEASARAVAAGAVAETGVRDLPFGMLATFADPFGHGFCFIAFNSEGYDAIAA